MLLLIPVANASPASKGKLILVIDDLGDSFEGGLRAVFLPVKVTLGILPETPYGRALARAAAEVGQESILHIPMSNEGNVKLGPAALTSAMNKVDLQSWLHFDIARTPHISGVNNHMGSELTSDPQAMRWFMEELACHRLYFLDSRTSSQTVAATLATEHGISALSRDVFLDNSIEEQDLETQFEQWLALARRNGVAIAIAHPYPETLDFLEPRLIDLVRRGYEFIHPSEVLATDWQAPLTATTTASLP